MHLHRPLFAAFLALCALAPLPEESVRERFTALDARGDAAAVLQLWKENPGETLGAIDEDLEGSLSRLEKDPKVDPAALKAMRERAIRGARLADEAFQTSIFTDYAVAFASWNADEQKRFREGQKLFREARKMLSEGKLQDAVDSGRASLELAMPLGDWWGSAMALGVMAHGEATLSQYGPALEHACQARQLDHDLRLLDAEQEDLFLGASAADGWERHERALALAQAGLALAKQAKNRDRQAQFYGQIVRAQEKLGDKDGAAKTREEYGRLPPKAGGK